MAILHVQDTGMANGASAASLQTGAFGSNPTVGNYIIGYCVGYQPTATTTCNFSDTDGGNSWTTSLFEQVVSGDNIWVAIGWTNVAHTSATFKVTATPTINSAMDVCASEFSGIAASSPLDGSSVSTSGTSTAPAPGNMTVVANDLVVALFVNSDGTNPATATTPGAPWNSVGKNTDGVTYSVCDCIYAINPASPTNPGWTTTSHFWVAGQLAFKVAAAGSILQPPAFILAF